MTKRAKNAPADTLPVARCAVYTRKSSEEGLEQEFNSLDPQREAGEAYVRSQAGEGWACLAEKYDGGFTGGNTDRPGFQRLMRDIEAGRVDCVVVYKGDRLSRSLLDFAGMMQTFERFRVGSVSATRQFNTASSMGRLVLNVLPSFTPATGRKIPAQAHFRKKFDSRYPRRAPNPHCPLQAEPNSLVLRKETPMSPRRGSRSNRSRTARCRRSPCPSPTPASTRSATSAHSTRPGAAG